MTGSRPFQRVQLDYEWLRATYPDLSHKELWRRANQAAVDYPDDFDEDAWRREVELAHQAESAVVDMRFVSSGGLSLRAVVGVVLVCIAMGFATASVVSFDHIPIDFRVASAALWWLSVFVLGPVGFALLVSARKQIERSSGAVRGQYLVWVGFFLAAAGGVAAVILFLYGALLAGGL